MKRNNPVRQVVFPLLAAFIWGTAFVAQDVCAEVVEPMTFNAVRSFIAVVVLMVIIWIFGRLMPSSSQQAFSAWATSPIFSAMLTFLPSRM